MILAGIRALLVDNTDVTDVVSQRIEPHIIPQSEDQPAISIRAFHRSGTQHLSGGVQLYETEVVMDCMSRSYDEAAQLALDCLNTLVGFKGTSAGVEIRSCDLGDGPNDSLEATDPGSDVFRYVTSCSVVCNWIA